MVILARFAGRVHKRGYTIGEQSCLLNRGEAGDEETLWGERANRNDILKAVGTGVTSTGALAWRAKKWEGATRCPQKEKGIITYTLMSGCLSAESAASGD